MAAITAALVKELREKSGAGMMDCKKALAETDGDIEAAVDWLRKKGLAAAAKKAGRVAAEGLVGVAVAPKAAAVIEVNSETDFVARNEMFQGYVAKVAHLALETDGSVEAIAALPFGEAGRNVQEQLTEMVGTIGENMRLRRASVLKVENGVVAAYVHSQVAPGMGKIGVLVALESTGDVAALEGLGKQIAMHVAAAVPLFLDVSSVDADALARERDVLSEQARASGKPEAIIEKMVDGRIRKYYEETVLLEQLFVIDGETKISKVIADAEKSVGAPVKLTGFVRMALGEGVEREEKDFAAEVAAAVKGA
ncbi:protein chain elongation factor EF-Ts [uncultured Alphaproteobacteria bacterium]|uniref:Elongation factor Ts n=1 Tax=uncultured Alphaproteobacteria bacterium TaxID=91750 RepID=A0A212J8D2_9PROT|nr:protein chain elongation factor EF-Ts [uncultured Alphaproteobacteria bacterium]